MRGAVMRTRSVRSAMAGASDYNSATAISALGYGPVAHSNYHWSFVLGLTENRWTWIEDSIFLTRLWAAEETEWAFPELCAAGELSSVRFSSRDEFDGF